MKNWFRPIRWFVLASALIIGWSAELYAETPLKISLCQIYQDPPTYNHKLVQVTAFISHSFENFSLIDPECTSDKVQFWVEYGGRRATDAIYCCGVTANHSRPTLLTIEGIPVPLTDNARFRELNSLLKQRPNVTTRVTLIGRVFLGQLEQFSSGKSRYAGFGHFGLSSLFAIQEVVSLDTGNRPDLDYSASVDPPELNKISCHSDLELEPYGDARKLQRLAESGQREWNFSSPARVAADALACLLNLDANATKDLVVTGKKQGQVTLKWHHKEKKKSYLIVVTRPYVLSYFAKDPQRVIWLPNRVVDLSCT